MNLHPRLAQDCLHIGDLPLCHVLLMQDASYPWFILVPARDGITEIHELPVADQQALMTEIVSVSRALEQGFAPDKLNIGALGNLVPQLHVHLIVRYRDDPAWPHPVWGHVARCEYQDETRRAVIQRLLRHLEPASGFVTAQKKR